MKQLFSLIIVFTCVMSYSTHAVSQSIYDLRKITEDEWLAMSTDERLQALSTAQTHEQNKVFLGDFGKYYDLYNYWGYEYYEQEDRYENYSFRNYEAYNVIEERRRRWSYNDFGDRISKMRYSGNIWRERFYGDGTYNLEGPWNYINATSYPHTFGDPKVDGVWVAREGTDDWAISVTGAGALRTKFTPLTVSIPNMNGISIDMQSANTSLKLISSAYLGTSNGWYLQAPASNYIATTGGVILRGGRFKRKFGVLTLGATYANVYGVQGNRERGNEWQGTVNNYTPTPMMLAIRFLDDSPEDKEGGPVVYDVRLKINGRFHDEFIPQIILDDVTRDRTTAMTNELDATYMEFPSPISMGSTAFDFLIINETIPKYVDLLYLNDGIKGANSDNVMSKFSKSLADQYYTLAEPSGKPIQANGTQTIVYLYDISTFSDKINRIEATATVANDYRIQTGMIYTTDTKGGHDASGKTKSWYNASFWRTVAQSEGNIKDGSNIKTVSFDFGFQVASIIYGVDADFNYLGFKMRGEYVTNSSHYMFSDGVAGQGFPSNIYAGQVPRTGHRWSQVDNAWYVTLEKDWEKYGIAGEMFKMGKFYKPYLDYYDSASTSDWMDLVDQRNGFVRVPLIEDNDDDDMFPDTMLIQRTLGQNIWSTEDPDGVFPGNDKDNDGIADNNKNNNGVPDYDEPFLMFDTDPDEYIFGDDFNNNNIPDFREDDMKLDTPYDLDRRGYHFYVRFTPQKVINLIAGTMRTKGIGLSNRTFDDYGKLILDYNVFDVGKLYAEYRLENIQDNIRDPYVQVKTSSKEEYILQGMNGSVSRFERELYYDELEYRNSRVNRLFLDSNIRAIPSITLENHIKLERNNQLEGYMYDSTYQPNDILNTMAMVNKVVYTKRYGNFVFSPAMKYRFYKKNRSESLQPLSHYLMRIPMVTLKYLVSDNTTITLGMQGIPKMEFSYTDYVQPVNNRKQKTFLFQIENKTQYMGYNIWGAVGIMYDHLIFDESYRKFEEYKSSSTFVKVFLGW